MLSMTLYHILSDVYMCGFVCVCVCVCVCLCVHLHLVTCTWVLYKQNKVMVWLEKLRRCGNCKYWSEMKGGRREGWGCKCVGGREGKGGWKEGKGGLTGRMKVVWWSGGRDSVCGFDLGDSRNEKSRSWCTIVTFHLTSQWESDDYLRVIFSLVPLYQHFIFFFIITDNIN